MFFFSLISCIKFTNYQFPNSHTHVAIHSGGFKRRKKTIAIHRQCNKINWNIKLNEIYGKQYKSVSIMAAHANNISIYRQKKNRLAVAALGRCLLFLVADIFFGVISIHDFLFMLWSYIWANCDNIARLRCKYLRLNRWQM